MPAPSSVAIGTAVANRSSWHAVPQQVPRLAGDFSCDCMFRGERDGGYTRQVGPSVDTAIMTTVVVCCCCCFLTLTDPLRIQLAQIVWTREVLARDAVRFGAHTRAQTLFGYFVSD